MWILGNQPFDQMLADAIGNLIHFVLGFDDLHRQRGVVLIHRLGRGLDRPDHLVGERFQNPFGLGANADVSLQSNHGVMKEIGFHDVADALIKGGGIKIVVEQLSIGGR